MFYESQHANAVLDFGNVYIIHLFQHTDKAAPMPHFEQNKMDCILIKTRRGKTMCSQVTPPSATIHHTLQFNHPAFLSELFTSICIFFFKFVRVK